MAIQKRMKLPSPSQQGPLSTQETILCKLLTGWKNKIMSDRVHWESWIPVFRANLMNPVLSPVSAGLRDKDSPASGLPDDLSLGPSALEIGKGTEQQTTRPLFRSPQPSLPVVGRPITRSWNKTRILGPLFKRARYDPV